MDNDELEEIDASVSLLIEEIEQDGYATLTRDDLAWLRNVLELL